MCNHTFIHGGVKYEIQDWTISGSSARPVWYFDWFYCEKCLQNQYRRLAEETNTYQPILFNATAKQQPV